ncbi:MAG: glycosyltransferase family A protein [Gammaproteobacteria bacterium]|nr:glycosyltransferase family A protein [Gammaproteobacteria bacterium]MCY4219129.1 glycosyltransferase family A protein [Gammaproteobacteria bacterium]MCY4275812.1 glycosyltransferase family A protein [Gammaproteobacteria bacterium]
MKISVIIPTYNRKHLIDRAIRSVLAQTHSAYEILVIDDGSTDGTSDMVASTFPKVNLIQQTNLGVSSARNTGIAESSGDWLAFLDSDDEWLPDKLKLQAELLSQNRGKIIHTDEIWIRNGRRINPGKKHCKPSGWIFSNCLLLCCVSPSSIMISRSVFDELGKFDESLPVCEDYDLWLRMSALYPFALVNKPQMVKYGGHPDQLSKRYWGMDRFRVRSILNRLESGQLNPMQVDEAKKVLLDKLQILIHGFIKRKKYAEADHYEQLRIHWGQS